MSKNLSRRELFRRGGTIAVGMMAPPWLGAITRNDFVKRAAGGNVDPDNVLVVCQFTGGNDGLNTLIPWADSKYYELRPKLGIPEGTVLKINESLGLHPSMTGIESLYKQGKVALVQGVGYPNPNRSHFKSMEIWQTASNDSGPDTGWLGRYFDISLQADPKMSSIAGLGLSVEKPQALRAEQASVPCFASLQDIQNMIGDPDTERMLREIQGAAAKAGSDERAVQKANITALDAMSELKTKLASYTPVGEYGADRFGVGFRQIAHLVATSPQTRVIYFSVGGFDTHARQADTHAGLLKQFSDAMATFQGEIETLGKADKVVTLVFSEFGRRSYENDSEGTDHGAAGPMMLIGKGVQGGVHGPRPSLTDLDRGDLKWHTDFRQVYATTLESWMGADAGAVLGEDFAPLPLLR